MHTDATRLRILLLAGWLLVLGLLGVYVMRNLHVSSDLRSFMPPPTRADQRMLMDQIGRGPGSRLLMVALSGAAPERLARLSRGLAAALERDPQFSQVANGDFRPERLDPHLLDYRYLLSPTLDSHRFDASYLHQQLRRRLQELASPAGGMLETWLPRDPTLEVLKLAQRWSPPHAPSLKDGVWMDARGQALLLVQTRAGGFDPGAQKRALDALQAAFASLPGHAGVRLTLSGPGYFSIVVQRQVRQQADWIGAISTAGFIVLLLAAYRSLAAVVLTALPVASGALAGLAVLVGVYPAVHGITLAFGFTLLGIAQEYPIRVLSHRRAGQDPLRSVTALWPLLRTAMASACIAMFAFYASGVPGLEQLAVFTVSGLLAAGLCTRYLFARILPMHFVDVSQARGLERMRRFLEQLPRPRALPLLLGLAVVAALWLAPGPFWQNNLARLAPVSEHLLKTDQRLRAALGAPDVRYLLVLEAPSAEGVLALSARMRPELEALVHQGAAAGIELPTRYLPPLSVQRARQQALPDRSALEVALAKATAGLPFRKGVFAPFVAAIERARHLPLLTPARFEQTPFGQRLASMLVPRRNAQGKVIGWAGLATVSGMRDPAAFTRLAHASHDAVRLLDIKQASEALVASYRSRILVALWVALGLLVVTLGLALRSLRRAGRVLAPMTLATLLVLAVERLAGIEISLFHLVALTLAAGLGLHYALFFERDTQDVAERRRTLHATAICVLTALLVFGMLALSTIPVLRAIGLTVALGVAFHFCLSVLMASPARGTHAAKK